MAKFKGFVGSSYRLYNTAYACERTLNLFPAADEVQLGKGAEIVQLERTPGLTLLVQKMFHLRFLEPVTDPVGTAGLYNPTTLTLENGDFPENEQVTVYAGVVNGPWAEDDVEFDFTWTETTAGDQPSWDQSWQHPGTITLTFISPIGEGTPGSIGTGVITATVRGHTAENVLTVQVTGTGAPAPEELVVPDATEIVLPYSASGVLTDETIIWYSFTLTTEQEVTIDLAGSEYDTYLVLYDAIGLVLGENDDFGGTYQSKLAVTLPVGTYYLASLGYGPNSVNDGFNVDITGGTTSGSFGNFTLSVTGV